jgi:hypothetical protein
MGDLTISQFGYSTATLASSLGPGGGNGVLNPSAKSVARARSNWRSSCSFAIQRVYVASVSKGPIENVC